MLSHELTRSSIGLAEPESTGSLRYMARQPILDASGRVHAYELLFRSGPEAVFRADGELATRTVIDNTVMFGLGKLTGGLPAFVNCTASALMTHDVGILTPSMTVLEILEDVEPTPELIAACRKLKGQGYRIALDDFVWQPSLDPLVALADFIKIDFIQSPHDEREAMLKHLRAYNGALLAEKVETREEYQQAVAEGFTLFQGYYFCRPMLLKNRRVPANNLVHLQLLHMLREHPLNVPLVSDLLKRDAGLTYRLLRLVNSAAFGVQQEIRSISSALVALGDDMFRRFATVAIASELNTGQSKEILRMAFIRARFCELTSRFCAFDPMEQYLLGMFSLLPAMLDTTMTEAISSLPLRDELRAALLGERSQLRCPLQWLESHERGDWETCDRLAQSHGLQVEHLHACFTEAVLWAEDILPITGARA